MTDVVTRKWWRSGESDGEEEESSDIVLLVSPPPAAPSPRFTSSCSAALRLRLLLYRSSLRQCPQCSIAPRSLSCSHEPQRHGPRAPPPHRGSAPNHRTRPRGRRRARRGPRRSHDGDDLLLRLQERGAAVLWPGHQLSRRDGGGVSWCLPIGRPVRGSEDGPGVSAAPQSGQRPLQLHAAPRGRRDGADGDAQDRRAADAKPRPLPADAAAHRPGGRQLLPDARLHDLQRVPLHRRGSRRRHGLLPVQLAEGRGRRHHRALPLVSSY